MNRTFLLFLLLLWGIPSLAASQAEITYDPSFAGGSMLDDRFAEPASANTLPQKSALLSNGDVLTVGIVPAANSTQGENLGLVHYSSTGQRIPWTSPSASFASYYNIYLTYPNSTVASFGRVGDVKVAFGAIYALVDYAGSDSNANVVAFTENGTFIGYYSGLTSADNERGIALVPYQDGANKWLLLVGNEETSGNDFSVVLKRFAIAAGGLLIADQTFAGAPGGLLRLALTGCNCSVLATDVKAVRTLSNAPTVYIVGDAPFQNEPADNGFVMAVNGESGQLLSESFLPAVYAISVDVSAGPAVANDILYLLDGDAGGYQCSNGDYSPTYSVRKILSSSLQIDSSFGSNGVAQLISPHFCTDGLPFAAKALVITPSVIAVSGYDDNFLHNLGSGSYYDFDPMVAILRLTDGQQTSFNRLPATQNNGQAWGDAQFSDIVVQDPGHVIAMGAIGFPPFMASHNAPYEFGTARLVFDEIFADGFEAN